MTVRQVAIRVKTDGKAEVKRDFLEIGQAGAAAQGQVAAASDKTAAAIDRQMGKWKQLAQAAKADAAATERNKLFGYMGGFGVDSGKSARDSAEAMMAAFSAREAANTNLKGRGLSMMQRQTLVYTASDIFASAASGASPAMIAMQQGPQVLQAFALEGGKVAATVLKLTGVFGGLAAILGTGTAAWMSHEGAMRRAEVTATGMGATAGLSAGQIEQLARGTADLGDVTVGAARDMAAAYLGTGRIGGEVTERLIAVTKRYAVATGQDAKDATKELAQAMADPARGAELLNSKLNLLDDGTVRYIQSLMSQNRATEAQLVLADALQGRLQTTATNVNVLGGAWDAVKLKASQAWAAMGAGIDKAMGGGPVQDRLAKLIKDRDSLEGLRKLGYGPAVRDAARMDGEIAALQDAWKQAVIAQNDAKRNQMAADARAVQDKVNPREGQLRGLQQDRTKIEDALKAGALADPEKARRDLAALDKEIAAVQRGYSSAAAAAAALKTEHGKAAAEARKAAAEAKRDAEERDRLMDLELRNKLEIAQLTDDKALISDLQQQLRLRQLIQQYEAAGIANAEAKVRAERQVGAELRAEMEAVQKAALKEGEGLKTVQQLLGDVTIIYDENADAIAHMKDVGEYAFDTLTDPRRWHDWGDAAMDVLQDVLAEMFRLAAINPLKNALFGQSNPTSGGGFFGKLIGGATKALFGGFGGGAGASNYVSDLETVKLGLPGFANGVRGAPGGLAWVGERGRELVRLPRGSDVFSNVQSEAMARGFSGDINIYAAGAFSEATLHAAVSAGVRDAVRQANQNVLPIINDAASRGMVG